jgi:hypothetical protein
MAFARPNAVTYDGEEIDEGLRAQEIVDFVLARGPNRARPRLPALGRNRAADHPGSAWALPLPVTRDGDREIIWPQNATPGAKAPYRGAGGREHGDVPLPELAALADVLRTQGLEDDEDLIRGMQEHFGLGRLAISTRQRFEAAIMSGE